jgi:hypothetical protein
MGFAAPGASRYRDAPLEMPYVMPWAARMDS